MHVLHSPTLQPLTVNCNTPNCGRLAIRYINSVKTSLNPNPNPFLMQKLALIRPNLPNHGKAGLAFLTVAKPTWAPTLTATHGKACLGIEFEHARTLCVL